MREKPLKVETAAEMLVKRETKGQKPVNGETAAVKERIKPVKGEKEGQKPGKEDIERQVSKTR